MKPGCKSARICYDAYVDPEMCDDCKHYRNQKSKQDRKAKKREIDRKYQAKRRENENIKRNEGRTKKMGNKMETENQENLFEQPKGAGLATNCLYYTACKASGVTECVGCPEFRPRRDK